MTVYIKTLKVIESCRNAEQLKTAENYVDLALKSCNYIESLIIVQQLNKKERKLWTN